MATKINSFFWLANVKKLYCSPDNRMILKQISKGDNHYLKKQQSSLNGGVGLSDTILKGTHPGTIYARFGPYIDASCQVWLHLAKLQTWQ
jgi:hypothetical protein